MMNLLTHDACFNVTTAHYTKNNQMKTKKWTQAQKIEQIERATTKLYLMVNQLAKEVQELKGTQNPK